MGAWFLAGAVAVIAAAGGDGYDGKYAGEKAFQRQLERLPELRVAALAKVKARLDLEPVDAARIRVEVRDAFPAERENLAPAKEAAFASFVEGKGAKATFLIRIHAEAIHSGDHDLLEEITHEMAHAVLYERMDVALYNAIPPWLKKGLAYWTAEQGPTRIAWLLSQRRMLEGGMYGCYPGLSSGEHGPDRFPEYFRAVEFVEKEKGAAAVATLAKLLVVGTPHEKALEQASGRPFEAFVKEAQVHALAHCVQLAPAGWEDFVDLSKLDREGKYADVIAAAVRFEKLHPGSAILGDVVYFRGKAERLTSKHDAAAKSLARLLGDARLPCHRRDEPLYQLGRVELDRRHPVAAADAFRSIVRDVPDSAILDPVVYWLALALTDCGRKDEARRWLDRFERAFPKSELALDAAKLRKRLR